LDDTNRRPEKLRANASLLIQVTVETCLGGNTSIKQALLHEIGKTSFVARLLQCVHAFLTIARIANNTILCRVYMCLWMDREESNLANIQSLAWKTASIPWNYS